MAESSNNPHSAGNAINKDGAMQRKLGLRQSALVSVIRGEEFDSVFAESALVHFTAPGHIDDVLRDFFAHGIGVGRPGVYSLPDC